MYVLMTLMNCKLYSQGTVIIMMLVTIQTCDNKWDTLDSSTISSELVVISTMLINAQVFYGEDGQGVMVKIQTWTGGMSIRVQHTSTTAAYEYEYIYIDFLICTTSSYQPYFIRCYILFYRYGKTSLSVFLLASTLGRGQPDSISSIHSYKSLPR